MKLSINQLKFIKSLHERKYRQKYHKFIVEGVKLAKEVLEDGRMAVEMIVALPAWIDAHRSMLPNHTTVFEVDEKDLSKISLLTTPNQVFLVVQQPDLQLKETDFSNGLSLYLDDIRDPGNFGTILRIADWYGIKWVFCSQGSVEVFNPKVIQASMGAFLRVNALEIDFSTVAEMAPTLHTYGAVLEGESIFETSLSDNGIIVLGNESKGLSLEIQQKLSQKISIPKGENGGAESLNVAVAAGIICAQFSAQKKR